MHPEVVVHLQVENTRRCCAAVARGEVNIAIVGGEIPRELEHLLQVYPALHPGHLGMPLQSQLH
jgi:hypothetical protein